MPSSPIDDKIIAMHAGGMKIREDAVVRSKAVYLALGILPDGTRDVLGIWIEQTAGPCSG